MAGNGCRPPRMPNKKEEDLPPFMRGYIHQETLLVPEKCRYKKTEYVVFRDNEPIWLADNGRPVTCPDYPEDLNATFDMLKKLWEIRPEIFTLVVNHLKEYDEIFDLMRSAGSKKTAMLICQIVIHETKKFLLKGPQ